MIDFGVFSGTEHKATFVEQKVPKNFDRPALEWFHVFLFDTILGLNDWLNSRVNKKKGCRRFHYYPYFVYRSKIEEAEKEHQKIEILPGEFWLVCVISRSKSICSREMASRVSKEYFGNNKTLRYFQRGSSQFGKEGKVSPSIIDYLSFFFFLG